MLYNIFIGYDAKESAAYHTLCQSILETASQPVAITPLNLDNIRSIYFREYDSRQSNTFSFSRFLVPFLMSYKNEAIYMDCDMMVTKDIIEVFHKFSNGEKAVSVVKHDYKSKVRTKYLGNKQYSYPRKNWSSFVHWNCSHKKNAIITPEFVSEASPATLHRVLWLDDNEIGEIDMTWNFLAGEYIKPSELPSNIHWTLGGPYFDEYKSTDYAEDWWKMFKKMKYIQKYIKK